MTGGSTPQGRPHLGRAARGASWLAALGLMIAAGADGRPAPEPGLSAGEVTALGDRLETAVASRIRLVPEADVELAALASRCASGIAPIRPRAFREAAPRLIGLPGGRVLVSTGLLAAVASDAEIVSALAHEAGHLQAGDALDRLAKAFGAARLRRVAAGDDRDALGVIAANIATGGILTQHGAEREAAAEDAARRAGCPGGLARIFERAVAEGRPLPRRTGRRAHPLPPSTAAAFPAAEDGGVEALLRLRGALGALP